MGACVAVIDIGKTNKKVCVFDDSLNLLADVAAPFPTLDGPHGLQVEDTAGMWDWFCDQLASLYRQHPFAAIAVTTHGATYALVDGAGDLVYPVVAYDSPLSADQQRCLDQDFYQRCGSLASLQQETGSCDLPLLINPAKSILYVQGLQPDVLKEAQYLLNYPQYWGCKLTGVAAAEVTYSANHSFLFDIQRRQPSSVAHALGVAGLLDLPLRQPADLLGTLSEAVQARLGVPPLPVAVGIHDSNAALLPYLLIHHDRDFVLNSTGTWCVAMHRVPEAVYADDELEQKIIFNIDAFGNLHKTSFLMGGQDYALYHQMIGGEDPGYDQERLNALLADTGSAILPGAFPSQFPGMRGGACEDRNGSHVQWSVDELHSRGPSWLRNPAVAHDYLNVSLAIQTKVALQRTGAGPGTTVFVEGGFRNNPTYLSCLAALMAPASVVVTDLPQATAGGTALLALSVAEGRPLQDYAQHLQITEHPVPCPNLPHLAAYERAFMERLAPRP